MKYPVIFLFRYDKYKEVDAYFAENKALLNFTVDILSTPERLNELFDSSKRHLLITYGPNEQEYHKDVFSILPGRIFSRWVHYVNLPDMNQFSYSINYCFIHNAIENREKTRPIFSAFTTSYNSYEKIDRAYNSLKEQTMKDWEWVIVDDSPDDAHFQYMREKFNNDSRVRLYRKRENSGNIGNVKNEAVSLTRGKYVLELDHDDEIVPDLFDNATTVFENDSEVGFVYADFINIYENGYNFHYGDFLCKGYAGYYCQKYKGRWVNIYITPNINNITLSHLVCCPNHPRIWRRDTLLQNGNYSEFLPICDDYEILLRTACNTKIVKIHKLGYIQYMNDNNNNFSLIRNGEINRIGPQFIFPQFYQKYNVHEVMREKNAYEAEEYIYNHSKIWERDETTYKHLFCNDIVNPDYDCQVCIIGFENLILNKEKVVAFQNDKTTRNDIIVLDNQMSKEELCAKLDDMGFDSVKCYAMRETSNQQLLRYFHLLYRSCEKYEIIVEGLETE